MSRFFLIGIVCLAEITSLLGIATFPALQPLLIDSWSLTNTQTGWINGIYFFGYLLFVPVLVSLTDRCSPKLIFLIGSIITAIASFGFAYLVHGLWLAMLFRFFGGVGLAATYMPGLKLLSDQLEFLNPLGEHSRAIAIYTSSFGVGSALSYFIAGEAETILGWQNAFLIAGLGSIVSFFLIASVSVGKIQRIAVSTHFLDFRPIFQRPEIMTYVFVYAVHNFELFAYRSWLVSYLIFAATISPSDTIVFSATVIAAATNLVSLPASIIGNELSRRFGRHWVISIIMLLSAALACVMGFATLLPYWAVITICILYGVTVTGESSSITAGLVAESPAEYKGAAMAVHSSIGFLGSFLGPLVFGFLLDISDIIGSGRESITPWVIAFLFTGLITLLGPVCLAFNRKPKKLIL